jgi:hypothetical protein
MGLARPYGPQPETVADFRRVSIVTVSDAAFRDHLSIDSRHCDPNAAEDRNRLHSNLQLKSKRRRVPRPRGRIGFANSEHGFGGPRGRAAKRAPAAVTPLQPNGGNKKTHWGNKTANPKL